jgi:hypothetical protein
MTHRYWPIREPNQFLSTTSRSADLGGQLFSARSNAGRGLLPLRDIGASAGLLPFKLGSGRAPNENSIGMKLERNVTSHFGNQAQKGPDMNVEAELEITLVLMILESSLPKS